MTTTSQRRAVYKTLSEELRNFLSSEEYIAQTDAIAQKFALSEGDDSIVDDEATLVLMGLQTEDDMLARLQEQTTLGKNKCVEIVIEASKTIFQPLRPLIPKDVVVPEIQKNGSVSIPIQTPAQPLLDDGSDGLIADHEETLQNPLEKEIAPAAPIAQTTTSVPVKTSIEYTEEAEFSPQRETANPSRPVPQNWEERKKRLDGVLPQNSSYKGTDPYREPIE